MLKLKSDEIAIITNKLQKAGKYEFPVVVRSTLNNLAFDMKDRQLKKSADEVFDYNRTNIIKALSWTTKAKGNNVRTMKATAGVRNRTGRQKVAKGLAAQEVGGKVPGKTTPTLKARGGNISRKVTGANRLKRHAMISVKTKKKEKFMAGAYMAKKRNAFLVVGISPTTSAIAKVTRFTRRKKKQPNIKLKWLYSIHQSKVIKPSNRRPFVKKAYNYTMKGIGPEYMKQAKKRLMKK